MGYQFRPSDGMEEPPLNDKGHPRWPHAHQQKVAYIDTEFLGFRPDHMLLTEVAIWKHEEMAPETWRIKPSSMMLDHIKKNDPGRWDGVLKSAKVNGYSRNAWKDCPSWQDVRNDIAKAVFGRVLIGNNVYKADVLRLESGFYPNAGQWIMPHCAYDLQVLAKLAGHKRTNLDALCRAYGLEEETTHHAEGGVRRVRAVCEAMFGVRNETVQESPETQDSRPENTRARHSPPASHA